MNSSNTFKASLEINAFKARRAAILVIGCLFAHSPTSNLRAEVLVIPNGYEMTPGNGSQRPFGGDGGRRQNIYNPSEFIETIPEGGIITEIAFRLNESVRGEPRTFSIGELEVRMSTSPRLPPRFGIRFSENIGRDETIVFPRNALEFTSVPRESGANSFDLIIPLSEPFTYDPREGSLVVDFFTYRGADLDLALDALGSEEFEKAVAISGNVAFDESVFTFPGMILQLRYSAVPEPRMVAILAFGMLLFALKGRRR